MYVHTYHTYAAGSPTCSRDQTTMQAQCWPASKLGRRSSWIICFPSPHFLLTLFLRILEFFKHFAADFTGSGKWPSRLVLRLELSHLLHLLSRPVYHFSRSLKAFTIIKERYASSRKNSKHSMECCYLSKKQPPPMVPVFRDSISLYSDAARHARTSRQLSSNARHTLADRGPVFEIGRNWSTWEMTLLDLGIC